MSLPYTRHAVRLAMFVVGLLLLLDIAYFARGSLEEFPTDEDHEKVRIVTAMIAALLVLVEVGLWLLLRRLKRGATPRARSEGR